MSTAIATVIGSVISGVVAILVSTIQNNKTMALVTYRLEQLEQKVNTHNNLVERMTAVETELSVLERLDR